MCTVVLNDQRHETLDSGPRSLSDLTHNLSVQRGFIIVLHNAGVVEEGVPYITHKNSEGRGW